ncbi:MAG TPA: LolA-related protein [Usitatibacteraceae bacterium]
MPRTSLLRTSCTARRAVLLVAAMLALFAVGPVHAEAFDLASLMQLLAVAPEGEVPYTEKKYSSLLAAPIVSTGTLAYRRPDTVEKITLTPRKERFRISGQELTVARNGKEYRIALSSQPLLDAFAASLRGVLAGDIAQLQAYYRISLEGGEQAWRLTMIPGDEEMTRHIERILVSGHAGRIAQIEVRESSGDRSVLQVH